MLNPIKNGQQLSLDASGNLLVNNVGGGGGGGGVQYNEGQTTVTATGTVALGKNPSNVLEALPLDASGFLKVNVAAGGGSGGTSSTFGAAFPGTGTAAGATDGTNMQPLQVDGSGNLKVIAEAGTVSVAGTSTVTVTGNVSINSTPTVAVAGTSTVQIAGITGGTVAVHGTSTVQIAGITAGTVGVAGTSTVTISGNVSINSTPTVAVAGISAGTIAVAGTSTVTVAGNVSINSTPTVAVAGTSTVSVAAIVGTSTVAVAGTSTVTLAGIFATTTGITTTNGTLNANFNLVTSTAFPAVLVQLDQGSTITAGAINFQVTYDNTNWVTVAADQVLDPTSAVLAQISMPYTLQQSTNTPFVILMHGAQGLRINMQTALLGTGTVTPNYSLLPVAPQQEVSINGTPTVGVTGNVTVVGQLTAPTGTQTVTVTGNVTINSTPTVAVAGTSTVQVAGISAGTVAVAGTSTVTVSGNVSINSTPTVAVAGTSTVQVAGISAGTVAVAGTSTVAVAGTSTVAVAGTSTVVVTGQIAGSVGPGTAASSSVLQGHVYNNTTPSLTNGQQACAQADGAGSLFIHPFRRGQLKVGTATVTGTSTVTLLASQGTSVFGDLLAIAFGFTSTSTVIVSGAVIVSDATNSYSFPITSLQGTQLVTFAAPLPAASGATPWTAKLAAVISGSPTVQLSCLAVAQIAS